MRLLVSFMHVRVEAAMSNGRMVFMRCCAVGTEGNRKEEGKWKMEEASERGSGLSGGVRTQPSEKRLQTAEAGDAQRNEDFLALLSQGEVVL